MNIDLMCRKRRMRQVHFRGPTCSKRIKRALNMGLIQISTPPSLEELCARKVAARYNSLKLIPEAGWPASFECKFASKLDAPIFVRYLRDRGGILAFKRSVPSADYQLVLMRLWQVSSDYTNLPLCLRQCATAQRVVLRKAVKKSNEVDHAFFRLGLSDTVLTKEEEHEIKLSEENRQFNFMKEFYRIHSRTIDAYLNLPACLAYFPELRNWTSIRQRRFSTCNFPEDLKIVQDRRFWNQSFLQCLALLAAMETSVHKARIHEAAVISSSLLLTSIFSGPKACLFKLYAYSSLAYALAGFCCRFDCVLQILNRMLQFEVYPSDRHIFYLAKQRVFVSYGLAGSENRLFEMVTRDCPFLPQSGYLKQFLCMHYVSMYRQCLVMLLEVWCYEQQAALLGTTVQAAKIKKIHLKVIQRTHRLQENMNPYRGSRQVHNETMSLIHEVDMQCRLLRSIVIFQQRGCKYAKVETCQYYWRLKLVPLLIVEAFAYEDRRSTSLARVGDLFLDCISGVERLTDFVNHPRLGVKGLEILGLILPFGLYTHCKPLVRDIIDKILKCFTVVSVLQPHWGLSLAERINFIIKEDKESLRQKTCPLGLTVAQQKASLEACSRLVRASGSDEINHFEEDDLISFFNTRDQNYLTDILSFGQQSIANNKNDNSDPSFN